MPQKDAYNRSQLRSPAETFTVVRVWGTGLVKPQLQRMISSNELINLALKKKKTTLLLGHYYGSKLLLASAPNLGKRLSVHSKLNTICVLY